MSRRCFWYFCSESGIVRRGLASGSSPVRRYSTETPRTFAMRSATSAAGTLLRLMSVERLVSEKFARNLKK